MQKVLKKTLDFFWTWEKNSTLLKMDPTQPIRNYGLDNHHKDYYSFYWLNIYLKICFKIDCDLRFIVQIACTYGGCNWGLILASNQGLKPLWLLVNHYSFYSYFMMRFLWKVCFALFWCMRALKVITLIFFSNHYIKSWR